MEGEGEDGEEKRGKGKKRKEMLTISSAILPPFLIFTCI